MPELHFSLRWPDGSFSRCYSPSSTLRQQFSAGEVYPLSEFVTRCREAFHLASERVRARYGFACSSAMAQLQEIETTAARFADLPGAHVTVINFEPPA